MGEQMPRKANLSAADVLRLNADVERVIAMGRQSRWSARRVKSFVMAIVPLFKRAAVNGHVDAQDRPVVRIHHHQWEAAARNKEDYADMRDAFGWFVAIPDPPMATTWVFVPPLTSDTPKRELGHTWNIAVMCARKAQRRAEQQHDATEVLHG